MKLAVHFMAYNSSRFLEAVVSNMEPFVDRIYIIYPHRPFNYNKKARTCRQNPTSIEEVNRFQALEKVKIILDDSEDEFTPRNKCLRLAREEGFDWLITQDADEFYPEESWARIRQKLLSAKSIDHFATTWYNFWKSSHYVLVDPNVGIKQVNTNFAIRCKSDLRFVGIRRPNAESTTIIDAPCFHYAYAMSDAEILEKVTTWAHTSEVSIRKWYDLKWLRWNERTRYLHPINPLAWNRAIRFPHQQPQFAEQFNFDLKIRRSTDYSTALHAWYYDRKASGRDFLRRAYHLLLEK